MHGRSYLCGPLSVLLFAALGGCDSARSPAVVGTGGAGAAGGGPAAGGGAAGAGGAEPLAERGTITVAADSGRPIPETAFGLNYWAWVSDWGGPVATTTSAVTALRPAILRIGGHNNDTNSPAAFTDAELDDAVAYARAVGAEPLLQVPMLADEAGEPPTAATAAAMVEHANVTMGYAIRYFSIGNEPDLYPDQGDQPADFDAADTCATFSEFASAMRAVDPSIEIVGPDLSWKYQSGANDWLTPFLEQCGDELDVVAVHRYPVDPAETTVARAVGDAQALRSVIGRLRQKLEATGHGALPLAITEANITWDGEPAISTLEASPGTFPAGLWLADTFGVGLEEGLWTHAFWSISEG